MEGTRPPEPQPTNKIQEALLGLARAALLEAQRAFDEKSDVERYKLHGNGLHGGGVVVSCVLYVGRQCMQAAAKDFTGQASGCLRRVVGLAPSDWGYCRSALTWLLQAAGQYVLNIMLVEDRKTGGRDMTGAVLQSVERDLDAEKDHLLEVHAATLAAEEAVSTSIHRPASGPAVEVGRSAAGRPKGEEPTFSPGFPEPKLPPLDFRKIEEVEKSYRSGAVLILTAVEAELRAVLARLEPPEGSEKALKVQEGGQTYYVGSYGKTPVVALLCEPGSAGRDGSLSTAKDAIGTWSPCGVICAGIAFGVKAGEHKIGDVLVSTKIFCYEPQRKGTMDVQRGAIPEAGRVLKNRFKNMLTWEFKRPDDYKCQKYLGPLLSGEKLVASETFLGELVSKYPDALGGEMEGNGLYAAAASRDITEWIVVKGICDWGDEHKDKRYQPMAAASAVSLVHAVLSEADYRAGKRSRGQRKARQVPSPPPPIARPVPPAAPPNRWAPWNLLYQEHDGRPYLTGPAMSLFRKAFSHLRYVNEGQGQPHIVLDRTYAIVRRVPEHDAYYLEPVEPADHQFAPVATSVESVGLSLWIKKARETPEQHDYDLVVAVNNMSDRKIEGYRVEVQVPRLVLPPASVPESSRSEPIVRFVTEKGPAVAIVFPGETNEIARIRYVFTDKIEQDVEHGRMRTATVQVRFFFEHRSSPIVLERLLRYLHNF